MPQQKVIPRNLYVLKSDIEKYGYTPLCPGCEAQMCDLPHRSHNHECRLRIQTKLQEAEEGKTRIQAAKARLEAGCRPKEGSLAAGAANAVVVGVPEPDAEMASGEAGGEPSERPVCDLEQREAALESQSLKRRRKDATKKSGKRSPEEDVEVLHEKAQPEKLAASGKQVDDSGAVIEVGPLPSAASREAQPERTCVASSASAAGDEAMLELGQFTECLCAVLRDARTKGTISEIFSPPRVAAQAQIVGMRPFCQQASPGVPPGRLSSTRRSMKLGYWSIAMIF